MSTADSGKTRDLPQGDLKLLESDIAQRLLASAIPARFAYTAVDGTPRVLPTWFHWTGEELVMPTFVSAPHVRRPAARLRALRAHPDVAITIDTEAFPRMCFSSGAGHRSSRWMAWCRSTGWPRATTSEKKPAPPISPRWMFRARGWRASRCAPPGLGSSIFSSDCRERWAARRLNWGENDAPFGRDAR
jgi:hypothetical protein